MLVLFLSIVLVSCDKNDYIIGGELHNPQINATTYDYLKSNRFGLFDTLLLLIDKAGLKDKINQPGTFFAPTDYAIRNYLLERTAKIQQVNPFERWTIDSVIKYELPQFIDSLNIYFVKNNLPNSALISAGTVVENDKGKDIIVSYEETSNKKLGFNNNSSIYPRVVYFTYIYNKVPTNFDIKKISYPIGTKVLVQSSNAQTLTGTLHVLSNEHILFFYK